MKMIKFTEVTHQWKGTAIVRKDGVLTEVELGVVGSDKKLKEVGAKEFFKDNLPDGTITVEVEKLSDVVITYELDSEVFMTHATVVPTPVEVNPVAKQQQKASK
jgi:hypothetical protein